MPRRLARWGGALLAVWALAFGVRPAHAQGTTDQFPEPLTSEEIEGSLDRIGVSGDSRAQALRSFEEYIGKYLDLRKGDIETYLQGRSDLSGSERTREEVASRVSARERLLRRIAALDNQLFDSIATVAGESAATKAQREKMRAERRRDWAASTSFMGRGSRIELSEILHEVVARSGSPLPGELQTTIDALLYQHEQSLTSQCRKLLDLSVNEPEKMFDARAEANLRRPQPEAGKAPAPDEWGNYFRGIEEIRKKVREPQSEVRKAIRKANREMAARIAETLPPSIGQSFRDAFMSRAYSLAAAPRDPSPAILKDAKSAAEKKEIDDETLGKIESLVTAHVARRNGLNDRIAEKIDDESSSSSGMFFFVDGEESEEKKPESSRLLEERGRIDSELTNAIAGLAPDIVKRRDGDSESRSFTFNTADGEMPSGATFEARTVMVVAGGEGGEMGEPIVFSESFGGDELGAVFAGATLDFAGGPRTGVVQPMQEPWVDRIRKAYGLAEDQASVLRLLFDDYRTGYREIEEGELAELKSLPSGMNGVIVIANGEEGTAPPKATAETTRRRYELKRSITQRTIALDAGFFDGLGAAFGDLIPAEEVTRLKHERERAAYIAADQGGGFMFGGFNSSKAPTVDLAEVVRNASLDADALKAIRGRLDAWDVSATDAFRSRYADRISAQESQEEFDRVMMARSEAEGRAGEIRIENNDQEFQRMEAIQKKAAKADDLTRSVNEGALEDMIAALPTDELKRTLRDAWHRKIWPQVFRDRRDVQPKIEAALAMEGVTDEVKAKIRGLAAEHMTEYRRIADEMIAANEAAAKPVAADGAQDVGFDPNAMRKRQETMNRLTFERDELNEKTFRRVKEQLGEELAKKLGDLPARGKGGSGISLPGMGEAHIRIGG
ncbi:MAG: hypothetical protein JNL80_18880 [Phycisphaerae bacterium]|nr:hypothetical protein [Phycisphaerae bacterium]